MPFPNFHAARVKSPSGFTSFATKNIEFGIDAILGIKEGSSEIQSYRFMRGEFTPTRAKKWLADHDVKTIEFEEAVKSDSGNRFDTVLIEQAAQKTDEGFLTGVAPLTRTGIFEYQVADGSTRKELRLPAEVFDAASLETLKLKPITNRHPLELVSPGTASQVQIGNLGENIKKDGDWIAAAYMVTDEDAIAEIEHKRGIELSCGYKCDLEFTPGSFHGETYDAIQRNIRYNHVAICDKARAGHDARIRLDQNDAVLVDVLIDDLKIKNEENTMPDLKSIKIDGVDCQAEFPVLQHLNKLDAENTSLRERLDSSKSAEEFSKLEADRDSLKEKLDSLGEEKLDDNQLWEKAKELSSVLEIATVCLDEKSRKEVEGKSICDIKKQIVAKKSKLSLDDIEKKDEVYISARYDSIVELLESQKEDSANQVVHGEHTGEKKQDSEDARAQYIARLKDAWQGEK